MKRLAILFLLIMITSSSALSGGTFGFGAHGSYANIYVPEPLKSAYGSGFGGGLHVDFRFGIATIRVNGDYDSFAADHDMYTTLIYDALLAEDPTFLRQDVKVDGGGMIGILSFGANGKFSLPNAKASPYAIVGIGMAKTSMSELSVTIQGAPAAIVTDFPSQTKFMLNVGAGVDFPLANNVLFLEVKYTWIFTENEKLAYLPITVGITF